MTRSIRAGLARPVRSVASSRRNASSAFCMWTSASLSTSSVIVRSFGESSGYGSNKRSDVLATDRAPDVARLLEIKDDQRDPVLDAQGQGGRVHDAQPH